MHTRLKAVGSRGHPPLKRWMVLLLAAWLFPDLDAAAAAVMNDSFAAPILLTGAAGSREGDNTLATSETGEPAHAGVAPTRSIWYLFHASSGGHLDLVLENPGFAPVLAVWVGKTIDTLTPVASVRGPRLTLSLVPGTVYRIAIDSAGAEGGAFTLRWQQTFLPGGGPDLVVSREQLSIKIVDQVFPSNDCDVQEYCTLAGRRRLLRFNMTVHNLGAEDLVFGDVSNSPLFHYAQCHNHYHFEAIATFRVLTLANDIVRVGNKHGFCLEDVIRYRADASTNRIFNCDYQGLQAGWSDIYSPDLPCQYIDITGVPAGDYLLQIELDPQQQIPESNEQNNVLRVPFHLDEDCLAPPPNDNLAGALEIVGRRATLVGNNGCATAEPGEPRHYKPANSLASRSLWYRWTAPVSESVTFTTEGSAFDTVLAVYTGTTFAEFAKQIVAQGDDIADYNRQSRVTFNAVAGTTYFIAVDGSNSGAGAAGGVVVLNLNPALNDAFGGCEALSGAGGVAQGSILRMTAEPAEPPHAGVAGGNSAWFCWTPSATGSASFDTVGSDFDTLLAVYTGTSLDSLSPVAADDDSGGNGTSRVQFNAVAGTPYHIVVDRKHGRDSGTATGVYLLRWNTGDDGGPPVIVRQPSSLATFVGSNAVFEVSAVGAQPLHYQWLHANQPVAADDRVTGAEGPTLRIATLKDTDRGIYSVIVSNAQGAVASADVNLVAAARHRLVYVDPFQATPERDILMRTFLVAEGEEHVVEFSLQFDPTRLGSPQVEAGPSVLPSTRFETDFSAAASGLVGVRVTLPPGESWPSANHWLATLRGRLASSVTTGQRVPICFADQPLPRFIADASGIDLMSEYACGNIIAMPRDILTARIREDGQFELRLEGMGGAVYEFQRSDDLQNWTPLAQKYNDIGVVLLVVPDWATAGEAFYRTVRQ